MKACILHAQLPVAQSPLHLEEVAVPEPAPGEVLIRVNTCAVCRTDLHIVEGELHARKMPLIPGHQVVGTVERGGGARFAPNQRVGVAWLHRTCGDCHYCRSGRENLCSHPDFTGYSVNGGFAEYMVAPEDFVYPIPDGFSSLSAAPLLCAGIIGFRALHLSGIRPGGRLGLYGFGAAAHVALQVARHWGIEVYALTRDERHRQHALELGAVFAGDTFDMPPMLLHAAIVFAPAGEIVPAALSALEKGGTLALGGIHMSDIPSFPYSLLYHERVIRSVANNTRHDGEEFLKVAAGIPIRTHTVEFPLTEANTALQTLKQDAIRGSAVLRVSPDA
ncbi:MAG: zinc-dependent alcohol dehydrogenase family protein [Bryobacterales bacterium]|nr:zinc-dependent alcohol dehydrogenase family protein [Bryobacterales bacterium]